MATGRPSMYTHELGQKICDLMADGMTVKKISQLPGMPERFTIYRWAMGQTKDALGFCDMFARAREFQAAAWVDEIMDISDDASNDYTTDEDGNRVVDHEHIQRSKLRAESRRWYGSKILPKIFGDKQVVEHQGQVQGVLSMDQATAIEFLRRRGPVLLPDEREKLLDAPLEVEAVEIEPPDSAKSDVG